MRTESERTAAATLSAYVANYVAGRFFDGLALFRAHLPLGGLDSRPAFGGAGPGRVAQAARLEKVATAGVPYELWRPPFAGGSRRE